MNENPYVPVSLSSGRLVRTCPECGQAINEQTDDDGVVSDNFASHWQAEHVEQPPERQRCYLLSIRPKDGGPSFDPLNGTLLRIVAKRNPEVDWTLVPTYEDLPEGAYALCAGDVFKAVLKPDGAETPWLKRQFTASEREEYWHGFDERRRERESLVDGALRIFAEANPDEDIEPLRKKLYEDRERWEAVSRGAAA